MAVTPSDTQEAVRDGKKKRKGKNDFQLQELEIDRELLQRASSGKSPKSYSYPIPYMMQFEDPLVQHLHKVYTEAGWTIKYEGDPRLGYCAVLTPK